LARLTFEILCKQKINFHEDSQLFSETWFFLYLKHSKKWIIQLVCCEVHLTSDAKKIGKYLETFSAVHSQCTTERLSIKNILSLQTIIAWKWALWRRCFQRPIL